VTQRPYEDPYCYPGTVVLRNKLFIQDGVKLAEAEADITLPTMADLETKRIRGNYDLQHLRAFHKRIFGPIYRWAGELRTVEISKGIPFAATRAIPGYAEDIFGKLARNDFLRGRDQETFLEGFTDLFGEVNALHPFREGNGRTQRGFLGQLARDAGHRVDWSELDPVRNRAVSAQSLVGNNEPLRDMLAEIVSPLPGKSQSRASNKQPVRSTQLAATGMQPAARVNKDRQTRPVGEENKAAGSRGSAIGQAPPSSTRLPRHGIEAD